MWSTLKNGEHVIRDVSFKYYNFWRRGWLLSVKWGSSWMLKKILRAPLSEWNYILQPVMSKTITGFLRFWPRSEQILIEFSTIYWHLNDQKISFLKIVRWIEGRIYQVKGSWNYLAYCRNHIRFVHVTNLEVLSWRKKFYNMVEILRRPRLKRCVIRVFPFHHKSWGIFWSRKCGKFASFPRSYQREWQKYIEEIWLAKVMFNTRASAVYRGRERRPRQTKTYWRTWNILNSVERWTCFFMLTR